MKKTLLIDQCIALLKVISIHGTKNARILDRALVISLLLSGGTARLWTWGDLETNFQSVPYAVFDAIRLFALSKRISITQFNYKGFRQSDWGNISIVSRPIFSVSTTSLTTQEVTRRLKRYARLAGIPEVDANLRTLNNTYQILLKTYGNSEAVAYALGLPTIWDRPSTDRISQTSIRDPRLHGIGRRGGL